MAGPGVSFDRDDEKERVRDASDIVRVIGEVVTLKAKGREYVGLCPFHDDKKPSMYVNPAKGIFKCFACGAGGDLFTFVQKHYRMEFREALEYLAERAGIELRKPMARPGVAEVSIGGESGSGGRRGVLQASTWAQEYFRAVYRHPEHGQSAREVVARRGISAEMVEAFGLGASAARWDGLLLTIQSKGAETRPFVEAGLLKPRDSGGLYDGFRNRLMFPIHDQLGRVIAFGGRKIAEEDEPKYLNSPESSIFEKAGTLYGLHRAAREIQRRRIALITEGYTDTIACHQAGFGHAVATLGTALTPRHASVLRRLCDTVVLMFDGDEAGQRAADRAVEVFFAEELDVKICALSGYTDAKDPDELLKREGGAAVLERAIAAAPDLLAYRYGRIRERLQGAGMSALGRAVEEELARLVQLGLADLPILRRTLIIKQLAAIAGVGEEVIARSVPGGRGGRPVVVEPKPGSGFGRAAASVGKDPRAEAIGCLLAEPVLWAVLTPRDQEELDPIHWGSGPMHDLADAMFAVASRRQRCGLSDLLAAVDDAEVQAVATELCERMERLAGDGDRRGVVLGQYLRDCLGRLMLAEGVGLEDLRQRHRALGGNRRALPRAGPMPPGSAG